MIEFESINLVYRELNESDASEEYVNWLNNPIINKYLEVRHCEQNIEGLKSFLRSTFEKEDEVLFGIFHDDIHIGNIKIGPINPYHRHADIGLLIGGENCRGRGFGTESIYAITRYCFEKLLLNKVEAGCYESNEFSYKGFIKLGFKEEGFLRDHFLSDGNLEGAYRLGMTRSDWESDLVQNHDQNYRVSFKK